MDSEDNKTLEKILSIVQQNNRILRKMRREIIFGRIIRLLYWVIIIGTAVTGYYYVQPYVTNITDTIQNLSQITNIRLPK